MTTQESLSKYQKLTDKEHILKKPDTYIGSIENTDHEDYIFNDDKIVSKEFQYIPGLYKLFDEGIVNCRDHVIRQAQAVKDNLENALPVTNIEITVDEDGTIHMYNDGNGIDVAEHPEYKIWIPEMIFGHLRTSTNYDEQKKEKIVGGKNGFGFKLVLIWSTWGKVETVDHVRGLKYIQEFKNNLNEISKPSITKCKTKPYTRVSFKPDYKRLGIQGLTADMLSLFKKRAYDVSAITDKTIKVKFNGQLLPCKNFEQYIDLYVGSKTDVKRVYELANDRWEYAVCLAPKDEFQQVSFVNGICTSKGGKHVEYIMNQIIRKLCAYIKLKKKVDVKPNTIKEQLMLFLRCDIENPSFNSQTKDELGTAASSFGSSCTVSDVFIEKIAKMGVMNAACALTEVKENKAAKKTDGTKSKSIRGIPKLIDANFAGTAKSGQCTLILCEGDSAKAGIVSGLSKEDRNIIGVYPMKGKIFNTRGETLKRISENKEIIEIKQILGLEAGKKYTKETASSTLRYNSVLFMTDQDLDGSHIKGLGLNLFQDQWNSLSTLDNFIGFMNTPILKAKKNGQELLFYNDGEYKKWTNENDTKGWAIKYYKGLGTSTSKEFKEYFANKKIVYFTHDGASSDNIVDMVFNKKRTEERKEWLTNYDRNSYLDTNDNKVSYTDFVNKELIHFSKYDCERSIPNMMDGLKISLRKILYSAFKKNLTSEIKVAQFSGYVSEHSGYHHGEASLNAAIVGMAQDYVGSNNINLLMPNGQFGCIDPETPVLLWNGNIEKAKNIKVNDKLIGDDGECRTVSKLTSGIDEMYEISNGNMDNYIVNSHHILTVYYSGHKSIFWKNSSNSWFMNYFDDNTKTAKSKSIRTIDSVDGIHKNKSSLTKEEAYNKILEFSKSIPDNNIFDINVQQYLALPNSTKTHIKGVINTEVVQWTEQYLPIDPYILGLWLGDGMSDCHAFASMDSEIIKTWAIWTDTIGCEICHVKNIPPHENHSFYIRRRGSSYGKRSSIGDLSHSSTICEGCITSKHTCNACDWTFDKKTDTINCNGTNINGRNVVNLNPFKELLKRHDLYKNKHVPINYIINSEKNRLELLAGMIDTDGRLKKQEDSYSYEISQCEKRKHILESFRIIAGSLGFRAKIYGTSGLFTLSITGDNIHKIPVKLQRKQIVSQTRLKNTHKIHKIEIKSVGMGPFCGWNIDKNERFLLGDFTITHNTRLQGGKDSASERYIFTQLNQITRYIYRKEDDAVLEYLEDDGFPVEPMFYVPIIPMILVNGGKGIGTGFSTDILSYSVDNLISYLQRKLKGESTEDIVFSPQYKGFTGTCQEMEGKKYIVKGTYQKLNDKKVRITELPVGYWTDDFKQHIENLMEADKNKKNKAFVKDYNDMSTDTTVDIEITFNEPIDESLDSSNMYNNFEKLMKLYTSLSTNNMHLFNDEEKLMKFDNEKEIVDSYFPVRLKYYQKRKDYMVDALQKELTLLSNKARYIQENLDGEIDLRKKKREEILELMVARKYAVIEDDTDYKYLLKMPMDSVSAENAEKLINDRINKEAELCAIQSTTIENMWLKDLDELKQYLDAPKTIKVKKMVKK
jgi:DNA gyrase/topoisomerase IV subunit B